MPAQQLMVMCIDYFSPTYKHFNNIAIITYDGKD